MMSSPIRALLVEMSRMRGWPETRRALPQKIAKAKRIFPEVMEHFYHRRKMRKLCIALHRMCVRMEGLQEGCRSEIAKFSVGRSRGSCVLSLSDQRRMLDSGK